MKKITLLLIVFTVFMINATAQTVGFNLGSSYGQNKGNEGIPGSSGKYVTGNGAFAFSLFCDKDFKLVGLLHVNTKAEFSKTTLQYVYAIEATDASGQAYKKTIPYDPINIYGAELGAGLKIKGKGAYIGVNGSPFINTNQFDVLVKAETGLIIKEKVTMQVNYSRGFSELEYGYKFERVAVGLGYIIGK